MAQNNSERLTKNQRREQARERARLAREAEKKRDKRKKLYIQGGVVLGVIAVLAIVALVVTQSLKPAGPGPRNMASGGFVLGSDLSLQKTAALEDGDSRVAPKQEDEEQIDVTIYLDYNCPHCYDFEKTNGSVLENWIGSGNVQAEFYPVAFQDTAGNNRNSTRTANLMSCVVDQSPDGRVVMDLHKLLFSDEIYPAGAQGGHSDEDLYSYAEQAGADVNTELKQCVKNIKFGDFIAQNAQAAGSDGILGLAPGEVLSEPQGGTQDPDGPQKLRGTPLVIVDGKEWKSQTADYSDFEQYLLTVQSEAEQQSGTPQDEEKVSEEAHKNAEAQASGDKAKKEDSEDTE